MKRDYYPHLMEHDHDSEYRVNLMVGGEVLATFDGEGRSDSVERWYGQLLEWAVRDWYNSPSDQSDRWARDTADEAMSLFEPKRPAKQPADFVERVRQMLKEFVRYGSLPENKHLSDTDVATDFAPEAARMLTERKP